MNSELKGLLWAVAVVALTCLAVYLAYRSKPEWFGDAVTVLASPTPGEVYRLRDLEKRVDSMEQKLAEWERGSTAEIKVHPGRAGYGEYVIPLIDSTGGVTELHIPVYTGGVTLLQGVPTIPLSGTR